ncbi:MAG: class I SAM-dependent methyltransferase [Thermoguttaceae bacterium]|nr:class I SAM-dependent methyltransferase [Thermoguttaceae bacterium]
MSERIDGAPSWLYDEFQHAGVDYANLEVARKYESRHLKFRDFDAEFERIRERAALKRSDVVLDLGCGTGAFAIPASRYCAKVYAADVSAPMLGLLRQKIAERKIENIETFAAGFLTFPTFPAPVDAVVSSLALHHLPDFWKVVALKRIADALKPGGVFTFRTSYFIFRSRLGARERKRFSTKWNEAPAAKRTRISPENSALSIGFSKKRSNEPASPSSKRSTTRRLFVFTFVAKSSALILTYCIE